MHLLRIDARQVRVELSHVWISVAVNRSAATAKMHGAGRRNRDLRRDTARHGGCEKLEMLDENTAHRPPEFASDDSAGRLQLGFAVERLEPDFDLARHDVDVDESRQKVCVPHRAPELAVRGYLEPDFFLHFDNVADRVVFALL